MYTCEVSVGPRGIQGIPPNNYQLGPSRNEHMALPIFLNSGHLILRRPSKMLQLSIVVSGL